MRLIILCCLIPFLVNGCGAPTTQPGGPTPAAAEDQAAEYLAAGNYNAAAEEYIRLAEKDKKNANALLLQAASAYVTGHRPELAVNTLSRIKESTLTKVQSSERKILYARLSLYENDAAGAIRLLDFTLPPDTPPALYAEYYRVRGQAYEQDGQVLNAVRARVLLSSHLDTEEELQENNHSIWELLSQIDVADLQKELAGADAELAGWLELSIVARTLLHNRTELETALSSWQARYSTHPAITEIIHEIYNTAAEAVIQPRQIALLLPFAGQYHDAATAIRDGFLAAWYETPASTDKPVVRIYNTANTEILEVYNKAVADGADFMVGPLEKEAVATLLSKGNLTVRMLALNQITGIDAQQEVATNAAVMPAMFQFGLLPEDETVQAADRAWFNGLAQALIITPDTPWGDRIYNAFSSHWQQLGGRIVTHAKIPPASEDLALPVKQLLNIDKSELRAKELSGVLGRKIHFEPRHRQDADLIFMAASPVVARQLIPQFRFFGVDSMAIYSISSVYSGVPDSEADNDINDIVFADMPWVVDPALQNSHLQLALNRSWEQNNSQYKRLYAFGIDAFRIIPELTEMFVQKGGKFNGVTGLLSVTREGYIQRSATWVRMVDGSPQLLN